MSCYMVEKKHVVYLVEAALSHRLAQHDGGSIRWEGTSALDVDEYGYGYCMARCTASATEKASIGNMLWAANLQSVEARYPDTVDGGNHPGSVADAECQYKLTPFDFGRRVLEIDPVQVLKSCACYRYQACEFGGWAESEAASFIKALERKAVEGLVGYDEAEWGAPETH